MPTESTVRATSLVDVQPIAGRRYLVIALCALVMFLDGLDTQAISYMAPTIAKEWALGRDMIGFIFSSALAGSLIGYLFLAPLSDRFGHRRIILGSTIAFGILTALSALASNVTELIVLRCLTGIGLGAVIPCAVALTAEFAPKHLRASFILAIYCGFSLGFVAAGVLAAWLLPLYGWRSLFWVGAAAPAVLSVILYTSLPNSIHALFRRRVGSDSVRRASGPIDPAFAPAAGSAVLIDERVENKALLLGLFRDGRALGTLLLWIVCFLNLAIFYALQSWLPSILLSLHYPLNTVALVTTMTTVGGIVAAIAIGPAMDRLGPFRSVSVLFFLGVLVLMSMGTALRAPEWLLLTTSLFTGVCISGGQKSIIALSALYYPASMRTTGIGWALGIGRIGGIGGPLLPSLFLTYGFDVDAVFYVAAAAMLISGALITATGLIYRTMPA